MRFLFVFMAVTLFATASYADDAKKGDIEKGRYLGYFCATCHGPSGSGPGENIPPIAGQSELYLENALIEMRDNKRYSTLMGLIAKGYSDEDIKHIAAYYSSQEWKNSDKKVDKKLVKQGKKIADEQCVDCHGDKGLGENYTPRIGGLPSAYLYYAMLEYKKGVRNMDEGGASMSLVEDLSDKELKALAEFYSSLK